MVFDVVVQSKNQFSLILQFVDIFVGEIKNLKVFFAGADFVDPCTKRFAVMMTILVPNFVLQVSVCE